MPPKILNLGTKSGVPSPISNNKILLPQVPVDIKLKPQNILTDANVQQTITQQDKSKFRAEATDAENKLPRFSIESVEFSIMNDQILNKLKVVNVSNNINRGQPSKGELTPSSQYSRGPKNPNCYENESGDFYALPIAIASQSITSYTEMGTMDDYKLCQTCFKTNLDCPGHLGEIKLNRAYVHPLFRDYLIMVLSSVCNSCSSLLLTADYIKQQGFHKLPGKSRLKAISQVAKKNKCKNPKCTINPEYVTKKPEYDKYEIYYYYPKISKQQSVKPINEIQIILKGISKEDAKLMGFNNGTHPKDMVMQSFAVMPPCARSFTRREGQIKEDHFTTAYDEIIRDNYKFSITEDENKRQRIEQDMYFHISHFIDNSDGKYCKSPTEKIKSIKERITKKEGLIRSSIMGKRVNFCGRSVIGPDSTLKFGEIGIPEDMFKSLTVLEKVHERNIEYITDLWRKRKITHFNFGKDLADGLRFKVIEKHYQLRSDDGKLLEPKIGWNVERYIQDGDLVLANRQPTLYKYGMPGNFIKKVNRKNIGLHMSETEMRNADFDGDEINIHVIQMLDARVEAMTFANSQACIPNALTNSAMIGMVYNALSSAFIMTREPIKSEKVLEKVRAGKFTPEERYALTHEIILKQDEFEEGLSVLTYRDDLPTLNERLAKYGINPRSGKALFSSLLPATLQYTQKNSDNNTVIIKDGVLVSGRITSKNIGRSGSSIQMSIWKWYGRDRAVAFVTDCTFLTNWFIYNHGLSIGFEDINPDKSIKEEVIKIISSGINEVNQNVIKLGKVDDNMTVIEKAYRETQITSFLSNFQRKLDKIAEDALSPENPLNIMMDSGAKGKKTFTASIIGLKGQEIVSGSRPAQKLSEGKRCLPYFEFDSDKIEARGFVSNSYVKGLTPAEMYFISEGAREGSISTATSTGRSGSLHHRLVKVLEDCKVCYDGSVRNANNVIYQMAYFDGYDAGEMVNSSSRGTGDIVFFMNIKEAVDRINAEFE